MFKVGDLITETDGEYNWHVIGMVVRVEELNYLMYNFKSGYVGYEGTHRRYRGYVDSNFRKLNDV